MNYSPSFYPIAASCVKRWKSCTFQSYLVALFVSTVRKIMGNLKPLYGCYRGCWRCLWGDEEDAIGMTFELYISGWFSGAWETLKEFQRSLEECLSMLNAAVFGEFLALTSKEFVIWRISLIFKAGWFEVAIRAEFSKRGLAEFAAFLRDLADD